MQSTYLNVSIFVGARPNYIKATQFIAQSRGLPLRIRIIDLAQHESPIMSTYQLSRHARAITNRICAFSGDLERRMEEMTASAQEGIRITRPDVAVVIGDVDATLAATIAAFRMGVPVAHVESGLRLTATSSKEEQNRRHVDALTDIHLVTEPQAFHNLRNENVPESRIASVGTLLWRNTFGNQRATQHRKLATPFALCTIHRLENICCEARLAIVINQINGVAERMPICFVMHPHTHLRLIQFNLKPRLHKRISILPPLTHARFLELLRGSQFVITDSGGIQEEAVMLNRLCITVRNETERPITLSNEANILADIFSAGSDQFLSYLIPRALREHAVRTESASDASKFGFWSGQAGRNIGRALLSWKSNNDCSVFSSAIN